MYGLDGVGWGGEGIATAVVNAPATGPVCSPLRSEPVNIIVELINLLHPKLPVLYTLRPEGWN